METTGELALLLVRERYRIYTDHCGNEIPALREEFDSVMSTLEGRIRNIGMRLLATEAYRDMQREPVTEALLGTLSAELSAIQQDLQEQDPELVCAGTLQSYRDTSDALLEDFLKRTLAGVRVATQTLKSRRTP